MTDEEKFMFDLEGYLHLEGVLSEEELAILKLISISFSAASHRFLPA